MLDLLQNVVDCFGPHERLGVLVGKSNGLVDRRGQFRHACEEAAPNPLPRDFRESSLDMVQPRGIRRSNGSMRRDLIERLGGSHDIRNPSLTHVLISRVCA